MPFFLVDEGIEDPNTLVLGHSFPLLPCILYASSGGSGETAQMRRLT